MAETMNKQTFALILLVNIAVISLGGFLAYYDLWMRPYTPIKVEWYLLGYRPTYLVKGLVVRGSWTLDFLQVSVLSMAIVDVVLAVQTYLLRKRMHVT